MTEQAIATEIKSTQRKARFAVGQRIVALRYVIEGHAGLFGNPMYRPWADKLERIDIVVLNVESQRDVPSCHEPGGAKCCTGFLLKDEHGRAWANQYPTASYGQVSDVADWTFDRQLDDYDSASKDDLAMYEEAGQVLSRIDRGISHFSKEGAEMDLPRARDLKTHLDALTKEIHDKTGASVRRVVIWKDHPDIKRVEFYWE